MECCQKSVSLSHLSANNFPTLISNLDLPVASYIITGVGVKSNAKYLYFHDTKLENLTKWCLIPLIKLMIIGTATDTEKALFYYYSSDMKIICTLDGFSNNFEYYPSLGRVTTNNAGTIWSDYDNCLLCILE